MAVAHYLEALDFQKTIVKVHTIYGGKNPPPELAVRRGAVVRSMSTVPGGSGPINMERLNHVSRSSIACIESPRSVPARPWWRSLVLQGLLFGGGLSSKSVMAYGDIPETPTTTRRRISICRAA